MQWYGYSPVLLNGIALDLSPDLTSPVSNKSFTSDVAVCLPAPLFSQMIDSPTLIFISLGSNWLSIIFTVTTLSFSSLACASRWAPRQETTPNTKTKNKPSETMRYIIMNLPNRSACRAPYALPIRPNDGQQ